MNDNRKIPISLIQGTYPLLLIIIIDFSLASCNQKPKSETQFSLLTHEKTGLDFRNMLKETETFNIFEYQYFYNGGGVAIADFNNDGLQDVCFTGNMVKNRMFLNKGKLKFEDITEKSRIAEAEGWCTGITAADINYDGWMDLYICRAGYPFEDLRRNLLYINNGDLTFTEKAAEYGLDDSAYATHSAFFDYDRDGDLDLFLLNHSRPEFSKGNLEIFSLRNKNEPVFGNKLYRNDDGIYLDVTGSSGITNNVLSFSLGLSISDINKDGWQDIFIGNDFNESDYLFINNRNGTFTESARDFFDHTSMFSMGSDVADINNDQRMDLVSLDMLPESNYLQKLHSGADNFDKVQSMISKGFQPQYSRNVLQINNGNNTFSEKGQMMGISNTDWSWSALFIDFDHDTYQDLFISNGYLRDHTDMDFLQFTMDLVVKIDRGEEKGDFEDHLKSMPPILQPNYFFSNDRGEKFVNRNTTWDLNSPSVSQGAAYGDLDNDGDVDIVVSNSNDYAWLYRNNENDIRNNNFISVKLTGTEKNRNGLGSKVTVYAGGKIYTKELQTSRGFQSSVENKLSFGLGEMTSVDSVRIIWPDGMMQMHRPDQINTVEEIKYEPNVSAPNRDLPQSMLMPTHTIVYERTPSSFNDFKSQLLLPYFMTDRDPVGLAGDINGDGRDDLIILGDTENPTVLFAQTGDGKFLKTTIIPEGKEISDGLILDVDADKDIDLIVTVGSYRYREDDTHKGAYIYVNDSKGKFVLREFLHSPDANPSTIASIKDQSDAGQSYLIGSISYQGKYPLSSPLIILSQKESGKHEWHKTNIDAGIVNDILIADPDKNGKPEVIIASEWKPLMIYNVTPDLQLENVTSSFFDKEESGLWQTIFLNDTDGDRKPELFAGNLGTNNQLTASDEHPLKLYYDDYDKNGSPDPIIAYYLMDDTYPFPPREDLIRQVPMMNKRFNSFGLYAKANIQQLLGDSYENAQFLSVNTLENSLFKWEDGKFKRQSLPLPLQVAPVFSFMSADIDDDQTNEILTAGNMSKVKVKLGRLNGNHGMVLKKQTDHYVAMDDSGTGILNREDIRQIVKLKVGPDLMIGYLSHEGPSHFYVLRDAASLNVVR